MPQIVTAAVIEQAGQILILRRAPGQKNQGLWEFPGGKLEPGEDERACLARELREELGVTASVGAFVAESRYEYPFGAICLRAYRCEITGAPALRVHDEAAWAFPAALSRYALCPADVPIARALSKKRIHILATGGTIAGVGEAGHTSGYRPGVLSIDSLIRQTERLGDFAEVTGEQFASLNSDDMTQGVWLALEKRIEALSMTGLYDGFVVTHGTDTLPETAYFLHLALKTALPVVMTGAMRPATATSPDGPLNLLQSVALAADDAARGHGVLVAFNEGIYSARDARKGNAFRTHAITGGDLGTLGLMREESPIFYHRSLKAHTVDTPFDLRGVSQLPRVAIASFHVDAQPDLLDYLAQTNDGLVVAGAGDGQVSLGWEAAVRRLAQAGLPVVRATRVSDGVVFRNAGMNDDQLGTVAAGTLSPEKARVLLMLALLQTKHPPEIQRMFDRF